MIAGEPLSHLRDFHGILTTIPRRHNVRMAGAWGEGRLQMLEVSAFFREDLVKWCELELSLVCYHYRRGWGRRPVSLFHSLLENSAKTD
jgi:hypothetical protein